MSQAKILVTGGAGYIGAHTVVELSQAGYNVVIIDNFSKSDNTLLRGLKTILGTPPVFYEGDCADKRFLADVFKKEPNISAVLHFAAYKSVGESVQKPLDYYKNNVGSLVSLLETMREFDVRDFIFSSSCTVYGQPDVIPVKEDAPFRPAESPYGATKQMCERILQDVFLTGFRVISLRYFNPIGAHPSGLLGELPIGVPGNLVPFLTQAAAGKREKLTVFGNDYNTPDGSCIRDYIHVVDVAVAHVKALEYLQKLLPEKTYDYFNLGTGVGCSVLELIAKFKRVTGVDVPFAIGPRRPGDVEKVYADPSKLNHAFNWRTSKSIEEALSHAWQWEKNISKP